MSIKSTSLTTVITIHNPVRLLSMLSEPIEVQMRDLQRVSTSVIPASVSLPSYLATITSDAQYRELYAREQLIDGLDAARLLDGATSDMNNGSIGVGTVTNAGEDASPGADLDTNAPPAPPPFIDPNRPTASSQAPAAVATQNAAAAAAAGAASNAATGSTSQSASSAAFQASTMAKRIPSPSSVFAYSERVFYTPFPFVFRNYNLSDDNYYNPDNEENKNKVYIRLKSPKVGVWGKWLHIQEIQGDADYRLCRIHIPADDQETYNYLYLVNRYDRLSKTNVIELLPSVFVLNRTNERLQFRQYMKEEVMVRGRESEALQENYQAIDFNYVHNATMSGDVFVKFPRLSGTYSEAIDVFNRRLMGGGRRHSHRNGCVSRWFVSQCS